MDSLHVGIEWIIRSTSSSILSGFGGWSFSLSCSLYEWVFNIGISKKAYRKLALLSDPENYKHPQASSPFCMVNEDKKRL